MLKMQNITSYYGSSPVLQNISFSVQKGNLIGILGRNGVGKTTLMRTIMGLTDYIIGTLEVNGEDLSLSPTHKKACRGIAYVPQGRDIIGSFTVRENILMGNFARRAKKNEIPQLVFELFPYLADNLNRLGGNLSGGQQQQLAIARALAASPSILLLDEPTEGIQPNIVEQIEEAIIKINKELGVTILLVEHHVGFIRQAAQQFMFLEKGRIADEGPIEELTETKVQKYMAV